uniref:Periphilin-1 C-terminal domain-containing protein n=1 Tax=Meloidogyne enterolobii TaxID=390850 RepID=A0A6V7W869_MELEN|nr:unnamed protein product [Meloidogyne enterolobii]
MEKIETAKSVLNFNLEEIQSQIIMECFGHSEFTELKFSKNQLEKEFTKRIPKILKLTEDAQLFKIKEKINKLKINYKINCTTFSQVTRKLIFKDKELQEPLILPFFAVLRDFEEDIWKGVDEFIDGLLNE